MLMPEFRENKIFASLGTKNCCLAFSLQYTNRSYPTMQFVVFVPTCFIQVSVIVILKKGTITISLVYISATIYSTVWIAVIVYLVIASLPFLLVFGTMVVDMNKD